MTVGLMELAVNGAGHLTIWPTWDLC